MGVLDVLKNVPTGSELKGGFGELVTNVFSNVMTDGLVLRDVLIDGADGYTSQIDQIVIGGKGVYVVEVKMFPEAKVYGDGKKSKWYYYNHGAKYEIYSPLKQNDKHIEYLKKLLSPFGEIPFFSIITMYCDDFKVSNVNPEGEKTRVVCNSLPTMKKALEILSKEKPVVIDEETKKRIFDYIQTNRYAGKEERQRHKQAVEAYKSEQEEMKLNRICPYCKVPLVQRSGKFGPFYGCPNYPKCKYTQE